MFDLHSQLLMGALGTTISGISALIGLGFVITGSILWWPTRQTFKFRIWPKRMSPSIIWRHRDLGVVLARCCSRCF